MSTKSIDSLPLRDKIREGERHLRELVEHLEMQALPRAQRAIKLTRGTHGENEFVSDLSVRQVAQEILDTELRTAELCKQTGLYLSAIAAEASRIGRPAAPFKG